MASKKVFIAHGRDMRPALELALLIERRYDARAIILEKESNEGKSILSKYEEYSDVDFAFIILTPDDIGGLKGEEQKERARQNVIFEWGHLIGKIGEKKTALLLKGDVEIPSDLIGMCYYRFHESPTERFIDFEPDLKQAEFKEKNAPIQEILNLITSEKGTKNSSDIQQMNFDFGVYKRNAVRVTWHEYSDIEIQGILRQYYASLGYFVDWKYTAERSLKLRMNCDLICTKDGKKTGIIARKRFDTKHLKMVVELAKSNFEEKICIFATPIDSAENIAKATQNLKIMDMKQFESLMERNEIGAQILCAIYYANAEFIKIAHDFILQLISITDEPKQEESMCVKKPLPELWQLKDHSIAMKATIETLLTLLDSPAFYTKANCAELLLVFNKSLSSLTHNMMGFELVWKKILRENKSLIGKVHAKQGNRSNWLGIWNFGNYVKQSNTYSPGILGDKVRTLDIIDKEAYEEHESSFASTLKKMDGSSYIPTPMFADFIREDFLRPHLIFTQSLEDLTDQIFEL